MIFCIFLKNILCDRKGKTLVIVRSKSYKNLFGGYATVAWSSNDSSSSAQGSFLFSLDKQSKHNIINGEEGNDYFFEFLGFFCEF